jgi:D-alanine-D-alanine ligase
MVGTRIFDDGKKAPNLPIQSIGIIYCTPKQTAPGREIEKQAECEEIGIAKAVQAVLIEKGYRAELVDLQPEEIKKLHRFDWVFNLAETVYSYPLVDYEVARKLEEEGINFTGSGWKTMSTCADKAATKCMLLLNGIGTPSFEVFQPGSPVVNFLRYPLFVKPVHEDGSYGITDESVVRNLSELKRQVEMIHRLYNQAALVEQFIDGRDITAPVIGNGDQAVVLPLLEIVYEEQARSKFLTFNTKWVEATPEFQASIGQCASLPPAIEAKIKDVALRAYRLMGCRDYARVDFRLRGRNPFVLEVNPNPCISPDTGFIKSAKAAGYEYADLVTKIVACAVLDRTRNPNLEGLATQYLAKEREYDNQVTFSSRSTFARPALS